MSGPWEDFQTAQSGPWEDFQSQPAAPGADVDAQEARQVAAQRVRRSVPGAQQYDERAAPTTGWSDVGGAVQRVAGRANDRIAETAGRALDAASNIVNTPAALLTGNELPAQHGVEDTYKRYFGTQQDNPLTKSSVPPATTWGDKVLDASGDMIGQNMPLMGVTSALSQAGRYAVGQGPTLLNAAKHSYNQFMDMLARNPVKAAAGETLAAGESGAVGEIARSHQEDEGRGEGMQRLAEAGGQIAGPTAMGVAPSMVAARLAKTLVPPIAATGRRAIGAVASAFPEGAVPGPVKSIADSSQRTERALADSTVNKELSTVLAKPEAQTGVGEAQKLQEQIPGFQPGLARSTNDPVLLNTQRQLDAEATGPELRTSQEAHDKSGQSLRDKFESLAPKVGENPQDTVASALQKQAGDENAALQSGIDVRKGQIKQQSDSLPQVDRIEGGEVMRRSREGAQRATDAETTRLRGAIGEADAPLKVGDQQMTVNQALDRRAAINQEMRRYSSATARSVDDVRSMEAMQSERDTLDTALNGVNAPGMKEYLSHYRDQNVPQFRQGASAEVSRRDQFGYGGNRVDPEQVGKKFFNPNEESAARQFNTAMGHDPAAKQQMIDNALDDIRHSAIESTTGMLKEGAVGKWLQKNERVLKEVPFVREAVNAKNPDALYRQIGELEQRQRAVADTKLGKLMKQGATPEAHIDAALNDWQVMRDLKKTTRSDPQVSAALTRAVMERAPDPATDPQAFTKWVNSRSVRELITPQHAADLTAIAKAAEIHNRLPRPQGAVELPKSIAGALGDKTGVTIPSAVGSGLAVARGRSSPFTELPMQAIKLWNRQKEAATNAAWREALSNPDMAKTVRVVMQGKQATPAQIGKMHTYLVASGLIDSKADDDE